MFHKINKYRQSHLGSSHLLKRKSIDKTVISNLISVTNYLKQSVNNM